MREGGGGGRGGGRDRGRMMEGERVIEGREREQQRG